MATGDGLFSATSGNPAMPEWLGPTVLDWAYTAETEKITRQGKALIRAHAAESAALFARIGAEFGEARLEQLLDLLEAMQQLDLRGTRQG